MGGEGWSGWIGLGGVRQVGVGLDGWERGRLGPLDIQDFHWA